MTWVVSGPSMNRFGPHRDATAVAVPTRTGVGRMTRLELAVVGRYNNTRK